MRKTIGAQAMPLCDIRIDDRDVWRPRCTATVACGRLEPGAYRAVLATHRPVYANLHILFEAEERPPLVMALDPSGQFGYAKSFHLSAASRTVRLVLEPALGADAVARLAILPLGVREMAAIGWQRLAKNVREPLSFARKLRQVFSGAASFSLTPDTWATMSDAETYQLWQEVFEGPAERARMLEAFEHDRDEPIPGLLAVYASASAVPGALVDFLGTMAGSNSLCSVHLLIIECAGSPLSADLRRTAREHGASFIAQADEPLPLRLIMDQAQAQGAGAFVFIEQSGRFNPLAFAAFTLTLRRNMDCMAVYADSDVLSADGERSQPRFKPSWSPDYALAFNYVGPAVAFRAEPALLAGDDVVSHLASPTFDMLLWTHDRAGPDAIQHIPRVLFHEAATELGPKATERRLAAECNVIETFLPRRAGGTVSTTPASGAAPQVRRISYPLPYPVPLVSVIIPTKDNPDLLQGAVRSVLEADYPAKDVVIVDNGSRNAAQHELLEEIRGPHVRIFSDPRPFNYSALNNAGRRKTRGDILLLLNDDIAALDPGWLAEMVSLAIRPNVGCVGALLLYPDDTVQHAGVVMGVQGIAGHALRHVPVQAVDNNPWLLAPREVSAVTGACLAVRTELFDTLAGLDEALPVTMNDVDFCLRARQQGFRCLFTPYARLYHYESRTRGLDTTTERLTRQSLETAVFMRRWGIEVLEDPFYSPHLSLSHSDFRQRRLG